MNRWVLSLFLLSACADKVSQPADAMTPRTEDATIPDAGICVLSGGCDWVVSDESQCPDVLDPNFCDGVCGTGECCWCDGAEPKSLNIKCTDGCGDAGL